MIRTSPLGAALLAGIALVALANEAQSAARPRNAPARPAKKAPAKPAGGKIETMKPGQPQVGQRALDFTLTGADDKPHSIANYRGRWVVLAFYPADFTKGCTAQVCGLRDEMDKIKSLNARVLGVSVQDLASKKKFTAEHNLNFPVLADDKREVATKYGVLTAPNGVSKRVTIYIDPTGVIRKIEDPVQPFSAAQNTMGLLGQLTKASLPQGLIPTRHLDQRIQLLTAQQARNPEDKSIASELAGFAGAI